MPDPNVPPLVAQSSPDNSSVPPVKKKRRWLLWGCGGLLAFLVVIVATVAITLWWMQRPIKPVVLSAQEKQVVDAKLQKIATPPRSIGEVPSTGRSSATTGSAGGGVIVTNSRAYVPGGKELRLTERELNGLLNQNTDLGRNLRLELDTDAINGYLAVPIPQDFPIGGGKMFRARGRFRLSLNQEQAPVAMLEDVTVLGLSLPKEWLGGLKGKNLLADAMGKTNGATTWPGVRSLRVVPGAIILEVGD